MYFTVPDDVQAHHYALGPYIKLQHIETGVGEGRVWVDAFEMYETTLPTLSYLDVNAGPIQINVLWILLVLVAAIMVVYPEQPPKISQSGKRG